MKSNVFVDKSVNTSIVAMDLISRMSDKELRTFAKHLHIRGPIRPLIDVLVNQQEFKLKAGDKVRVDIPLYWYGEEEYEVGKEFIIEEQHLGHNFEKYVSLVK